LDDGRIGDDGQKPTCAEAQLERDHEISVEGEPGNVATAIGLNIWFELGNAASSYFRPLTNALGVRPSYMESIPPNQEFTGQLAAGVVFLADLSLNRGKNIWTKGGQKVNSPPRHRTPFITGRSTGEIFQI